MSGLLLCPTREIAFMAVDPQRVEIPGDGEPASGGTEWLDSQLEQFAQGAKDEATAENANGVPSPSPDTPRAPSGEPASDRQDDQHVPSPDAADAEDDPAIASLERREGESRKDWTQRVQAFGEQKAQEARDAETRAKEAEQKAQASLSGIQQQYEQMQKWLGPEPGTPEHDELEQKALDWDADARQQFETFKERRQYQNVIRLANFAEWADTLEGMAELEGLSRESFQKAHGNQFPQAVGLIVKAAVGKVSGDKDATIAKLKDDLKNEQTAHQSTKDRALAGGLQPVSGGRPGGGGPLGQYTSPQGIPNDDAISAALEGRLAGLDLTN